MSQNNKLFDNVPREMNTPIVDASASLEFDNDPPPPPVKLCKSYTDDFVYVYPEPNPDDDTPPIPIKVFKPYVDSAPPLTRTDTTADDWLLPQHKELYVTWPKSNEDDLLQRKEVYLLLAKGAKDEKVSK